MGTPTEIRPPLVSQEEFEERIEAIETGGGHFHFVQNEPAAVWVIPHGLGFYPNVRCRDTSGRTINGDITDDSVDQTTIDFGVPFAGTADAS